MEKLYTTKEAAEYLRMSPNTLAKWRWEGKGPAYIKLGRNVRYPESSLQKLG